MSIDRISAPIDVVCETFSPFARVPETEDVLDTLRLLIGTSEAVPHFWSLRACPTKGARLVQELTEPDYYEQPLQQRFENAMCFASRWYHVEVDVFRMALSRDRIPSPAINMTSILGESLLHAVASQIDGCHFYNESDWKDPGNLQGKYHSVSSKYRNFC